MKLKPRSIQNQVGPFAPNVGPANFTLRCRRDRTTHCSGDELPTKANAEHRFAAADRRAYPLDFWGKPVADAGVIPGAPGGTEGNDHVVVVCVGKGETHVWFAELILRNHQNLVGLEAALAKALADWPSGAHVVVLYEQNLHS